MPCRRHTSIRRSACRVVCCVLCAVYYTSYNILLYVTFRLKIKNETEIWRVHVLGNPPHMDRSRVHLQGQPRALGHAQAISSTATREKTIEVTMPTYNEVRSETRGLENVLFCMAPFVPAPTISTSLFASFLGDYSSRGAQETPPPSRALCAIPGIFTHSDAWTHPKR